IGDRDISADLLDAHRLALQSAQWTRSIVQQKLIDLQCNFFAGAHLTLDEMRGNKLVCEAVTHGRYSIAASKNSLENRFAHVDVTVHDPARRAEYAQAFYRHLPIDRFGFGLHREGAARVAD